MKSKTQHDDGTSVRSLCDGLGEVEVEGGRRAVPGGLSGAVHLAAPELNSNVRETPSAMNFLRENSTTLVCSVRRMFMIFIPNTVEVVVNLLVLVLVLLDLLGDV